MSELQAALLIIGFSSIAAVYIFGWWQQRRYQQKFGATFKSAQADALYQGRLSQQGEEVPPLELTTLVEEDHLFPNLTDKVIVNHDSPCLILNERSDFIIQLRLAEPSPASVLQGLWQRKFNFGKPVNVCGLTLINQKWEKVITESQTLYTDFQVALQLVDRGGLISTTKLAEFRDLVFGVAANIKAQVLAPDVQDIMHFALQLDAFCVLVDQMVGINLMPAGDRLLSGSKISQVAAELGMTLESDGAFHLLNSQGNSLFSLINRDTKAFQRHTLEHFMTSGITLLLDVPRVENPSFQFDQMLRAAHDFGTALQVNLVDDHRVELREAGLMQIRDQIVEVEAKMHQQDMPPGSAQARRLFS